MRGQGWGDLAMGAVLLWTATGVCPAQANPEPVVVPLPARPQAPDKPNAAIPIPAGLQPGQPAPKGDIDEPSKAHRLGGWYLASKQLATRDTGEGYYTFARDRSEARLTLLVNASKAILDARVRSPEKYEVEVAPYDCGLAGGGSPASVYLNLNTEAYRILVAEGERLVEKRLPKAGPLHCVSGPDHE